MVPWCWLRRVGMQPCLRELTGNEEACIERWSIYMYVTMLLLGMVDA